MGKLERVGHAQGVEALDQVQVCGDREDRQMEKIRKKVTGCGENAGGVNIILMSHV